MAGEFCKLNYKDRKQEYIYDIKNKMDKLVEFEKRNGGIVLDSSFHNEKLSFNPLIRNEMPPIYKYFYRIKSGLVVRSWILSVSENKICEIFQHYFKNKKYIDYSVVNRTALGRWKSLIENLIKKRGHIDITAKFQYHNRQKLIQMCVGKEHNSSTFVYGGCMEIGIQEPDGFFNRVIKVKPEVISNIEIEMYSKFSHLKSGQKLITRLENEINGPNLGWIQLDPNLRLVGSIKSLMNNEQSELMAQNETDILSQFNGIINLESNTNNFNWLLEQISNKKLSSIIRLKVIDKMKDMIFNSDSLNNFSTISILALLLNMFCEKDETNYVLKENCWETVCDYQIHLKLIETVSMTYIPESIDQFEELLMIFTDMLESSIDLSDISVSNLKATIINAIGNSFSLVRKSLIKEKSLIKYLEILNQQLFEDISFPSHKLCLTSAVLHSYRKLEQLHLINNFPISFYFQLITIPMHKLD